MLKTTSRVYKFLVAGVIVLFIGISLSPCIKAVDKFKINTEEIGATAEYKEIITYIFGWWVSLNWINRRGFFRGEVNMTNNDFGIFKLSGLRLNNGSIEYFEESAIFVYAYRFIGYYTGTNGFGTPCIQGITLGDIEWR